MVSRCARCGADLPLVDGDAAAFCAACGLPVLRVSPDALAAKLESTTADLSGGGGTAARPVLAWAAALRILFVVGTIGAVGPMVLPGAAASGAAAGISWALMPLLVLASVLLYHRSRPRRDISPVIGGRLGAALGLVVGAWGAFLAGVVGFVGRYRYHSHAMDDAFKQSSDAMAAYFQGSPLLPEMLRQAQLPESRAGQLIVSHVMSVLLLVFAGTVCGWMAGAVLRSRRQRMVR